MRHQVWGEDTRGNLAPRKMRPQSCMGLGEKCLQAQKIRIMPLFTLLLKSGQRGRPLRSINAHAEQKGFEGQRSEATVDQTRAEQFLQNGNLLSLNCRPILVLVRPLHRHDRTLQVHLQVQHQSEVTNPHQETGAIHQKTKTKIKRGITIEPATTVCETFRNG